MSAPYEFYPEREPATCRECGGHVEDCSCEEEWRQAPSLEGRYDVSNYGRVRSWLWGRHRLSVPRLVKLRIDDHGYWCAPIKVNGKCKHPRVHSLVLKAFRGARPAGMMARHLDDNKANNRLSNLAWGTHAENTSDAIKHGLIVSGESQPNSKLTREQVAQIRDLAGKKSHRRIAADFGVAGSTVGNILNGRTWKEAPAAGSGHPDDCDCRPEAK